MEYERRVPYLFIPVSNSQLNGDDCADDLQYVI